MKISKNKEDISEAFYVNIKKIIENYKQFNLYLKKDTLFFLKLKFLLINS